MIVVVLGLLAACSSKTTGPQPVADAAEAKALLDGVTPALAERLVEARRAFEAQNPGGPPSLPKADGVTSVTVPCPGGGSLVVQVTALPGPLPFNFGGTARLESCAFGDYVLSGELAVTVRGEGAGFVLELSGQLTVSFGGRTLLLELSMSQYPVDVENVVFQLRLAGVQVVFAHPERIRWFEDDVRRYEEMVRLGAFGQITTGSLLGSFGESTQEFSEELMRKRLVHVIASDAHNTRGRRPEMSAAVGAAARFVGESYAARMADEFPRALLEGRDPAVDPPQEPPPAKRSLLGRWFGRDGS